MNFQEPDTSQWKTLFEGAARLKKLAPWEWMEEQDIFGVKDPVSCEIGFVSIMGAGGDHFAMGLYLGLEALGGFWEFQRQEGNKGPEQLFEIPQLQVSFEDRKDLESHDYRIIKDLGLRFRGQNAWPKFQSFRPGYWPWKIDRMEAAFLAHAIEQACEVALMVREDPRKLEQADRDGYLVRVSERREGDRITWEDRVLRLPGTGPRSLPIHIDPHAMELLKGMPLDRNTVELDFFMVPASIGEKGERPAWTYVLMMVDGHTGLVLGCEPMMADPDLDSMRGNIPMMVIRHFTELEFRPWKLVVKNELLYTLLRPFTETLGFRLEKVQTLEHLDTAKNALIAEF